MKDNFDGHTRSGFIKAAAALKLNGAEQKLEHAYVTKSVWDQVQTCRSAELGIGQAEPDKIAIEDVRLPRFDQTKDIWK